MTLKAVLKIVLQCIYQRDVKLTLPLVILDPASHIHHERGDLI